MNKLLYPYRPQREDLGYTRASLQNLSSQGLLLPPTQTCNKQRVDTTNMACVFFAFPSGIALWTPKPFRSSGLFSLCGTGLINIYVYGTRVLSLITKTFYIFLPFVHTELVRPLEASHIHRHDWYIYIISSPP